MEIDPLFLREGLLTFILIVVSIVFHEWGHAVVADLLGDDTPRADGRVTLNPMAHIDPVGTIAVPLVNIFLFGGAMPFIGWGRPVVTGAGDPRSRWRNEVLIALAGPAANLLVALVAVLVGSFAALAQPRLAELVRGLVFMNVGLAVFNLLPVPPLDGAVALRRLVGMSEETFLMISRWSWVFVLALTRFGPVARAIGLAFALAFQPYAALCAWINPNAFLLIFRT
jgi:Zn-dependent protease